MSCSSFYLPWEELEDNKGVIRSRKSKDRQRNGQNKKDKMTNNDPQNITHKTKDRVTRTPLNTVISNQFNVFAHSFNRYVITKWKHKTLF